MKISAELQNEILEELFLENEKILDKRRYEPVGSGFRHWLDGSIAGIALAMDIVRGWNKPDHGKVRADVYRCDTAEHKSKSSSNP